MVVGKVIKHRNTNKLAFGACPRQKQIRKRSSKEIEEDSV